MLADDVGICFHLLFAIVCFCFIQIVPRFLDNANEHNSNAIK